MAELSHFAGLHCSEAFNLWLILALFLPLFLPLIVEVMLELMGEFDLIETFFKRPPRHATLGVGDDCALLAVKSGQQLAISLWPGASEPCAAVSND